MPPGPQGGNGPGPGGPIRAASFQEYPDRYPRYAEGGSGRDPYGRKGGVDGGGQDEYQALRQRYDEEYWFYSGPTSKVQINVRYFLRELKWSDLNS